MALNLKYKLLNKMGLFLNKLIYANLMELIRNSLVELDNLGLRLSKLNGAPFEAIQKILVNQDLYVKMNNFINILNCKVDSGLFLTAFAMRFNMAELVENSVNKENVDIYNLIVEILNKYEDLHNNLNEYTLAQFKKQFNIFNEKFTLWKKNDLIKVIENYAKMFWSLEMTKKIEGATDEQKNSILLQQNKIKETVLKIGGREAMDIFTKYTPVMINDSEIDSLKDQLEKTYKKAYWDKLEQDLNNQNYDSIILILEEIRSRIALLVPNRIDIHLIKQMLDNNAIDNKFIYGLVNYIIENLKQLEAPIQNEKTEEWRQETLKELENVENINKFFPMFFQKVYDKIEVIENEVKLIKESKLYEKIKNKKNV